MNKVIAISAGHHSAARGAEHNGLSEWPLTKQCADELYLLLSRHCLPLIVPSGKLTTKVTWVNALPQCDLALEIHFNAAATPGAVGSETLYCPGSLTSKAAAEIIQRHLGAVATPDRGVKEGWYQGKKGGAIDYFLKATNCPAVIVEPFFIYDPKLLIQSNVNSALAAIDNGVKEVLHA